MKATYLFCSGGVFLFLHVHALTLYDFRYYTVSESFGFKDVPSHYLYIYFPVYPFYYFFLLWFHFWSFL